MRPWQEKVFIQTQYQQWCGQSSTTYMQSDSAPWWGSSLPSVVWGRFCPTSSTGHGGKLRHQGVLQLTPKSGGDRSWCSGSAPQSPSSIDLLKEALLNFTHSILQWGKHVQVPESLLPFHHSSNCQPPLPRCHKKKYKQVRSLIHSRQHLSVLSPSNNFTR